MTTEQDLRDAGGVRSAPEALHLLDATMLYSPAGGGVVRYLQAKRAWLAARTNVRHTLLVPGPADGRGPAGETHLRCARTPGVRYRVPADLGRWCDAIVARRPDVVEVGDLGPIALAALAARRRAGMPVVLFCHADVERSAHLRYGRPLSRVVRGWARTIYRRADRVIAPSHHMRERLADAGVEDVAVCPLGVDLEVFHPRRGSAKLRMQLGLPRCARLLVYAGRFAPEKNLGTLLDAVGRLGAPYHLLLVGTGALPPRPRNTTVLPFEGDPVVLATMLASADAFVHAGDQETFGLAFVEAMACGLPVVAAQAAAAPEIVTAGCGHLVPPGDASRTAEAIDGLWQVDRARMGRAARARAEQRFGWDRAFAGLLHEYGLVTGRSTAPGSSFAERSARAA